MAQIKNIQLRIEEIAQNDALQMSAPRLLDEVRGELGLGMVDTMFVRECHDSYVHEFWLAASANSGD